MKLPALITLSSIATTVVSDKGTCASEVCIKNHRTPMHMAAVNNVFGTIPAGGWSAHVSVSGGLEWLYALPIVPDSDYYEAHPNDVFNTPCCCEGSTYPPCVEGSGFRLPTRAEVSQFLPTDPPECMADYCYNVLHYCDYNDYAQGLVAVADEANIDGCHDTVYVRPVGTLDGCISSGGTTTQAGGSNKKPKPKPKPKSTTPPLPSNNRPKKMA